MGYKNEKTPAGETTGVNGVSDGGDLNHRQHTIRLRAMMKSSDRKIAVANSIAA